MPPSPWWGIHQRSSFPKNCSPQSPCSQTPHSLFRHLIVQSYAVDYNGTELSSIAMIPQEEVTHETVS